MIKYLIHFRSLTLICLYLGGRRDGGGGGGGGGGRERGGGAQRSGFHLSISIMEPVLSPLSIWQKGEKETETWKWGNVLFFFPSVHLLLNFLCGPGDVTISNKSCGFLFYCWPFLRAWLRVLDWRMLVYYFPSCICFSWISWKPVSWLVKRYLQLKRHLLFKLKNSSYCQCIPPPERQHVVFTLQFLGLIQQTRCNLLISEL